MSKKKSDKYISIPLGVDPMKIETLVMPNEPGQTYTLQGDDSIRGHIVVGFDESRVISKEDIDKLAKWEYESVGRHMGPIGPFVGSPSPTVWKMASGPRDHNVQEITQNAQKKCKELKDHLITLMSCSVTVIPGIDVAKETIFVRVGLGTWRGGFGLSFDFASDILSSDGDEFVEHMIGMIISSL